VEVCCGLPIALTQFSGSATPLKCILFDEQCVSFRLCLQAAGRPIKALEVRNFLLLKITPCHPSGVNFCFCQPKFSLNKRDCAILLSPIPCFDRQSQQHKMSRPLIELRHAAFVYVANVHGGHFESEIGEDTGPKKKRLGRGPSALQESRSVSTQSLYYCQLPTMCCQRQI